MKLSYSVAETSLGSLLVVSSAKGVRAVRLVKGAKPSADELRKQFPEDKLVEERSRRS